ncbi:MAG: hypothetical protein E7029_01125 [Planctomycetaceae bacterium]|nr:hypothetical protein [Planctomycetaceae bacterium]
MSTSEKIRKILAVSGLLSGLIFLTLFNIYLGNLRDYSFTLQQLGVLGGVFCLAIFGMSAAGLLLFVRSRFFPQAVLSLFAFCLCLWFQGSFLLWPLGGTPETIHDFSGHPIFGILELVIYFGIFRLVFHFRSSVEKKYLQFSILILFSQLLVILPALCSYRESSLNRIMYAEHSDLFRHSSQENIILLVLDSLESDYFSKVCASSSGEVEKVLKDFEYFPRFLSMYPQTFYAMPTLLTGNAQFDETKTWDVTKNVFEQTDSSIFQTGDPAYFGSLAQMYSEQDSFLRKLRENAFRTELYSFSGTCVYFPQDEHLAANIDMKRDQEEKKRLLSLRVLAETIIPHTLYRLSPLLFKPTVFDLSQKGLENAYRLYSGERISSWDGMVQKTKTASAEEEKEKEKKEEEPNARTPKENALRFAPLDTPFFTVPSEAQTMPEKCFKLIHLYGMHFVNEYESRGSLDQFTQTGQTYFLDGVGSYLEYLKKSGVYENSWIVICGDHGFHGSPVSEQFHPVLLVKRPNTSSTEMTVNDQIVLLRDVAPTLLTEQGIRLARPYSFWDPTEEQKKEREALWQKFYVENLTQ